MLASRLLGLCAAVLLLPAAAHAQHTARTYGDTVPLAPDGTVALGNHGGSITVTTWDRPRVQYRARVVAEKGADHPERTTVSVDPSQQHFTLKTEYDESDGGGGLFDWGGHHTMPVHYTLKIPATARLTIDDHESKIEVTGLRAALRIDTHEGPVAIARQQGTVTLDTHESPIHLEDVTGNVRIDTHESEATVENLRGGFTMDTHEGHARVAFGALEGDVRIDAHEGDFTLLLPRGAGFDLATDLDDDADLTSPLDLRSLRITEEDEVNYRGAVQGGGPRLHLSSHEGHFHLRVR